MLVSKRRRKGARKAVLQEVSWGNKEAELRDRAYLRQGAGKAGQTGEFPGREMQTSLRSLGFAGRESGKLEASRKTLTMLGGCSVDTEWGERQGLGLPKLWGLELPTVKRET